MYLSQLFRELDKEELWKNKITRENLTILPCASLKYKEHYFIASSVTEKVKTSPNKIRFYLPLYNMKEEFINSLHLVLPKEADYCIHSLIEKSDILRSEMQEVERKLEFAPLVEDLELRRREIKEICLEIKLSGNQGKFRVVVRETNIRSWLFGNRSLQREKLLPVLMYYQSRESLF
ncbi:Hypothetical protein BQ3484_501 [Cedratvirus A11]|uniref:Uncharacterized protein n=1 Tax=Cedratvirus A11 TaxID=1903266 RepID=A0A1M7XV60_9VIRU|nr:Hypothetical protein BQ3484_501 [Cedratvirus A11]SHO33569.1 Hypothetical protein BQ3484_501 [Cedratvirus A11]